MTTKQIIYRVERANNVAQLHAAQTQLDAFRNWHESSFFGEREPIKFVHTGALYVHEHNGRDLIGEARSLAASDFTIDVGPRACGISLAAVCFRYITRLGIELSNSPGDLLTRALGYDRMIDNQCHALSAAELIVETAQRDAMSFCFSPEMFNA